MVAGGFSKTAMGWELCQRWGKMVSGNSTSKQLHLVINGTVKSRESKPSNQLISSGAYNPLIQKAVSAEADACNGSETLLISDGLNVSSSCKCADRADVLRLLEDLYAAWT